MRSALNPTFLLLAITLDARTLAAQSTPATTDRAIGFQIVVPRPSLLQYSEPNSTVMAIPPTATCPMPVAKENSAADAAMVRSMPASRPSVPMPVARAGCRNPLAEARTGTAPVP